MLASVVVGRPWQFSLRWDEPLRDRRTLVLGLVVAVLMTLIELVGFGFGMRPRDLEQRPDVAIQVTVLDLAPTLPIPALVEPPQFKARPSKIAVEAPKIVIKPPPPAPTEKSNAMSARIGSSGAPIVAQPPPLRLFNPDGTVALPAAPVAAPNALTNTNQAGRARWAELERRGENPLDCTRSRFSRSYKADQSLGDEVASKYLKWIGLANPAAIQHNLERRERRAAEGCDPPPK